MKKALIVGCGAYMDTGYGCPGEWRCLKAAALGDGTFVEPHQVVGFLKCLCPGRSTVANAGMMAKLSQTNPDVVHLSSCLANAKPGCPHFEPVELAAMLEAKLGLPVILGTHDYH
jgi:predicted metal-binding protein